MTPDSEQTIGRHGDVVLVKDERGNLHVIDRKLADVPPIRATHHEIRLRPRIEDKQREVVEGQ